MTTDLEQGHGGSATPAPTPAPTEDASRRTTVHRHLTRGVREIIVIVGLWLVYSAGRHLADSDPTPAKRSAEAILGFEQSIHIDIESWLNHATADIAWFSLIMCFWYAALHYTVTPAVLAFVYLRYPSDYSRVRNALVLASAMALVVYILLPTAPPRLVPGYIDTLGKYAQYGWWSAHASAPAGMQQLTNELAAMPSLHVGWTLWVAWALHTKVGLVGRLLTYFYVLGTTITVLCTANHWTLDIVAGLGVVWLGILISNRVERWKDGGGLVRLRGRAGHVLHRRTTPAA